MANAMTVGAGSGSPISAASGMGGGAPVALQDKLARCQRQLGDWEACASSKTPEGKKIIHNLRAQIGNIESRIQSQTVNPADAASDAPGPRVRPPSLSLLGSQLNVFA